MIVFLFSITIVRSTTMLHQQKKCHDNHHSNTTTGHYCQPPHCLLQQTVKPTPKMVEREKKKKKKKKEKMNPDPKLSHHKRSAQNNCPKPPSCTALPTTVPLLAIQIAPRQPPTLCKAGTDSTVTTL